MKKNIVVFHVSFWDENKNIKKQYSKQNVIWAPD
jgi:hypothetical protein